jgi:hypothetical protein
MMKVTGATPEVAIPQVAETDWIAFPGGELEGPRPKALCPACRDVLRRGVRPAATLCFACHQAERAREHALKAAGELDTASEARFQSLLPLEPVNHSRLVRLRAERETVRVSDRSGTGVYVDKRRQAQIAARHALQQIGAGLRQRAMAAAVSGEGGECRSASRSSSPVGASSSRAEARAAHSVEMWAAIHAAELQLPETWLPFVTAR